LKRILAFLVLVYTACYIWPTRWHHYDHAGATPIRMERATGRLQFCTTAGWRWESYAPLGPLDESVFEALVYRFMYQKEIDADVTKEPAVPRSTPQVVPPQAPRSDAN
jgi:hypothetical protein